MGDIDKREWVEEVTVTRRYVKPTDPPGSKSESTETGGVPFGILFFVIALVALVAIGTSD